jgi:hypothetical protein
MPPLMPLLLIAVMLGSTRFSTLSAGSLMSTWVATSESRSSISASNESTSDPDEFLEFILGALFLEALLLL